ncbi:MAG TPA: NADH-quinone oxidoreductase subunit A [Bdellovibrionota bacterium]|nr:NADH-quinone oxidoreductase subunit A [Bdellovibrionota bacterium]
MLFDFANALVFAMFGIGFVLVSLFLARLLAPRRPTYEKSIPYECGELPVGTPWIRFNPRYYVFALIFIIFDVEIAFMYPCAVLFREWVGQGLGKVAYYEIAAFVGFLIAGLAYAWRRGDLEWIRSVARREESESAPSEMRAAS